MRGEWTQRAEHNRNPAEQLVLFGNVAAEADALSPGHYDGGDVTRQVPAPADLHDPEAPMKRPEPARCCGRSRTPGENPAARLRRSFSPPLRWGGSRPPTRFLRGIPRLPGPAGCIGWRAGPRPPRD